MVTIGGYVAWIETLADGETRFQLMVVRARGASGSRGVRNPTVFSLPPNSPVATLLTMTAVVSREVEVVVSDDGEVLSARLTMMGGPD